MINAFRRVANRKVMKGDESFLFPLMTWFSGNESNLPICAEINRNFFYVDKTILIRQLSNHLQYRGMGKYPKPTKFDKKVYDFVAELLKKKYFLGKGDIVSARKVIEKLISDKTSLEKLANDFGLDNNKRKMLGLIKLKFEKKRMVVRKSKSLLDF